MRRAASTWIQIALWPTCLIGSAIVVAELGTSSYGAEPADNADVLEFTIEPDAASSDVIDTSESSETPAPPAKEAAAPPSSKVAAAATHRQANIIKADVKGQPTVSLSCFSLTSDDRILAGCAGQSGELRVFDSEGKYLETWPVPVKPDAIFIRADGAILLAGEGQLLKLTPTGKVEVKKQSPHAAALLENPDKLREEVVAQAKQQAEMVVKQTKQFDEMIERADKEIATIKEQIAAAEKPADTATDEGADQAQPSKRNALGRNAGNKQSLERRIAMLEQQKKQYDSIKAQYAKMAGKNANGELSDAQIDEQVKASMAYKLKTSSISATDDEVFVATPSVAGYGFEIWRMDDQFDNAKRIVTELKGCCGQMDVKANKHGLFVAENSRHRVCRFDREGKPTGAWGQSARTGLEGFGSCCNPMNVAFGPGDEIYTAEDTTGRIKRYSVEGKLLGLVGSAEVVPGCKNVAIAVSKDGSRVYMLDITRKQIVRMDARPAGDVSAEAEAMKKTGVAVESADVDSESSPKKSSTAASGVGAVLKALFSIGN